MNIARQAPDTILHNGIIHTLDAANTAVEALAIQDGRIVATGANGDVLTLADVQTEIIDLAGRAVLPGLFDSHAHLWEVGIKLTQIRLDECRSAAEMADLVRERAKTTPPGTWIIGQGWNENLFESGGLPTKHDIDPATDAHPVILMRFFNMDVVNSVALRLAGITRDTEAPEGGRIERDPDGEPNGILRAAAKLLVRSLLPEPTQDELQHAIKLGCEHFNTFGITSIVEPGLRASVLKAYQATYQAGDLSVRVNMMPSWHGFYDDELPAELDQKVAALGLFTGLGDDWLKMGGLKMAIDGGTSSRTAYMYEPFEGESEVINYNRLDTEALYKYFRMAQENGWDVGIHVTGDRAMDMAVDTFARVMTDVPRPDMRHNIIHAYFPSDRAMRLMAEHQIAAVIQPTFLYWEGDMLFRDVGHERAKNYKPARKFLDSGVPLAANSDVPSTVSVNPFVALAALVTRRNIDGNYVARDQAISREEALRAYTQGGTWLTREESLKGSLEVGKLADLVVIDRDYFGVSEAELWEISAELTIIDGEIVYDAR